MHAVFATVMSGFTLPTAPSAMASPFDSETGSVAARRGSRSAGGDVSTYLQQVRFLKRLASAAWNTEYVGGRTATDPGRLMVRYAPITVRSRSPLRGSEGRPGAVTKSRVEGVTAQVTANGAVNVMCVHTDPATAMVVTEAVRQDLLEALTGLGPVGCAATSEEDALVRFALSDGDGATPLDELAAAAARATRPLPWASSLSSPASGSDASEASLRSFTAYLYPVAEKLIEQRRRLTLPRCADGSVDDGAAFDEGRWRRAGDESGPTLAGQLKRQRTEGSVEAVVLGRLHTGRPGRVRLNVRGDAGLEWIERLVSVQEPHDGSRAREEEGQVIQALCRHAVVCAALRTPELQESARMADYLAGRRRRLREHLLSVRVHRIANRNGIQLALQWRTRAAVQAPEVQALSASRARTRVTGSSTSGQLPAPTAETVSMDCAVPSVAFFFKESTVAPFIGDEVPARTAAEKDASASAAHAASSESALRVGESRTLSEPVGGDNTSGDSLSALLRAAPSRLPEPTSSLTPTWTPGGFQMQTDSSRTQYDEGESVNCIVFASGKVQFTARSVEALREVVQLVILPFLLFTGDLTA